MEKTNVWAMAQALEVAKEHARSGNTRHVEVVLEQVYFLLKKLDENQ